jgi:hypothetical protein
MTPRQRLAFRFAQGVFLVATVFSAALLVILVLEVLKAANAR